MQFAVIYQEIIDERGFLPSTPGLGLMMMPQNKTNDFDFGPIPWACH